MQNKKINYYYTLMYKDEFIDFKFEKTINPFIAIKIKNKKDIKNIVNNIETNKYKSNIYIVKLKYTIITNVNSINIKDNCETLEISKKISYNEFLLKGFALNKNF